MRGVRGSLCRKVICMLIAEQAQFSRTGQGTLPVGCRQLDDSGLGHRLGGQWGPDFGFSIREDRAGSSVELLGPATALQLGLPRVWASPAWLVRGNLTPAAGSGNQDFLNPLTCAGCQLSVF